MPFTKTVADCLPREVGPGCWGPELDIGYHRVSRAILDKVVAAPRSVRRRR